MKKLPVGKQNFQQIIEDNFLYVDKTRQIYDLIEGGSLYFLSRPRRFGKSLLISTLKQIFRGNKDLFKGLYIGEKTNYDWTTYPVLQFNFAKTVNAPEKLANSLTRQIIFQSDEFGIELKATNLRDHVDELVIKLSKKHGPVVFLVDEYDKPIIDYLTDIQKSTLNRDTLKDFFAPLKDLEEKGHLRFLFVTGVSKFSKVSIFSDLNNLTDLTIHPLSKDLLGITNQELHENFTDYITHTAQKRGLPEKKLLEGIKLWYNGYSYDAETFLYNPFSLLHFFLKGEFGNFWFATGTPTFLVNTLRNEQIDIEELKEKEVVESFFDKFDLKRLDIYGLLFQTGYLTIKSKRPRGFQYIYRLDYPNEEVRQSFTQNLLEAYTYKVSSVVGEVLLKMETALQTGKIENFIVQLEILLSDISYHLTPKNKKQKTTASTAKSFAMWEGYFHTIIYLICVFLSLNVQAEVTKHKGRLDLLVETDDFLYLMEFKLEESAENAIAQIKSRKYAQSFKNSKKEVWLVGIGFSKELRNVESWEAEKWN